MHVPDGFLDVATSARHRRRRRGRRRAGAARRPSRAGRPDRPDGRPRRRRSCSPPRCSTSPSAPAPAATCSAARWRRSWSGRAPRLLCLAVVLLVQALLFADGGVTALGTNITLLGDRHRRRRLAGLPPAPDGAAQPDRAGPARWPAVAAFVSVPVDRARLRRACTPSAGRPRSRLAALATAMVGWHTAHRTGRGRDHRPGGRQRRRRTPRPRPRRPPGPGRPHARGCAPTPRPPGARREDAHPAS